MVRIACHMEARRAAPTPLGELLTPWLERVTEEDGPFSVERLSGGNSNETLLVSSPRSRSVLRRPPTAMVDASAHNIEREYRMLIALADTLVPVPRPIAMAREPTPGGPPGLLMQEVDGVSITDRLPAGYSPGGVRAVAHATVDALAELHSLPWRDIGLEDFGRPEGFLERQVGRWQRQYASYKHRELDDFDVVARWLEEHRPPEGDPGILHGDFHVDNCLFSRAEPAELLAIIDWEMSTIGDPLLDVGLFLALWGNERPEPFAMPRIQGFSRVAEAPTRAELAQRYAERSGRSLEHLDYYMTLALWKLAAIVEGAHLHFTTGALTTEYARELEHDVPRLLAEARAITQSA